MSKQLLWLNSSLPLWFLPAPSNTMMLVVIVLVVGSVVFLICHWFRVVAHTLYRTSLTSVASDDPESMSVGLKLTGNNAMIQTA